MNTDLIIKWPTSSRENCSKSKYCQGKIGKLVRQEGLPINFKLQFNLFQF